MARRRTSSSRSTRKSSATGQKRASTRKRAKPVAGNGDGGRADSYTHPEAKLATRPDVGTQAGFRKKKPAVNYKYDSSLSPALDWDGQNPARERGEKLIADILAADSLEKAKVAAAELESMSRPFLDWSGKAERLSFDVPTLPLFVHERLSTQAILETLKRHRRDEQEILDLFGDPRRSITDQVMRAYEHRDKWVNRLVLGDSLVVMNSLLEYEGLGGQVQMIYIDPPYGVKFGSNFQPFVRKRDVKHNDDSDMTREPEMVQAYRDTWELGLHSYLTYLRDRLLVARELLTPGGSVFVQISDENLHHVREVMDEVFGVENAAGVISFAKTTSSSSPRLPSVNDFLLWYGKDIQQLHYNRIFLSRAGEGWVNYDYVRLPDGTHRRMTQAERQDWSSLLSGASVYRRDNLTSRRPAGGGDVSGFEFEGKVYSPGKGT